MNPNTRINLEKVPLVSLTSRFCRIVSKDYLETSSSKIKIPTVTWNETKFNSFQSKVISVKLRHVIHNLIEDLILGHCLKTSDGWKSTRRDKSNISEGVSSHERMCVCVLIDDSQKLQKEEVFVSQDPPKLAPNKRYELHAQQRFITAHT